MAKQQKEEMAAEGFGDDYGQVEEDILNFDFADTHEVHTVPDGEYRLRVLECRRHKKESTGSLSIFALFELIDEPYAQEVRYYMGIPADSDSDRVRNKKMLRIQEFFEALGVEPSGIPYSALVGYECDAILTTSSDLQYGEQNQIGSFVVSA